MSILNPQHRARRGANQNFDGRNLAVETDLQRQVTITSGNRETAQGVKEALALRKAARERAHTTARENAQTAADNLKTAQLATQTLLDAMRKGKLAKTQAAKIRDELDDLAKQAYLTAEAVSCVTDAVDTLARTVQARVGKNELITSSVRTGVDQAKADAKKALEAILVALQDSVRAFAAASLAADIARDPLALGEQLLCHLLEEEAVRQQRPSANEEEPKAYEAIQQVSALRLWETEPCTMHQIVASLENVRKGKVDATNSSVAGPQMGLLNLLSAVKSVTQRRDYICQEALTVAILEDSTAQNELDRSTQKLTFLQAALQAAGAALR